MGCGSSTSNNNHNNASSPTYTNTNSNRSGRTSSLAGSQSQASPRKRNSKKSTIVVRGGQKLNYSQMKEIVQQKQSGILKDVPIIDVRSHDEIKATGLIPTAVVLPLSDIEAALSSTPEDFEELYKFKKPEKDDYIILYCLRGVRTDKSAAIFERWGYSQVDTYPGSWIEWSEEQKKGR